MNRYTDLFLEAAEAFGLTSAERNTKQMLLTMTDLGAAMNDLCQGPAWYTLLGRIEYCVSLRTARTRCLPDFLCLLAALSDDELNEVMPE